MIQLAMMASTEVSAVLTGGAKILKVGSIMRNDHTPLSRSFCNMM